MKRQQKGASLKINMQTEHFLSQKYVIEIQVIGQVVLNASVRIFHARARVKQLGMNSSCGFLWAIKAKTLCPFWKMVLREIYYLLPSSIVSSSLSSFSKQRFLQRFRPLKVADVIYIHTINHFLNEVNSFQMLCVTPEWKGLCMTHSFKKHNLESVSCSCCQ